MPRRDETFILYYWEDYEQYEVENPSCYYCLSESTVQILLSALRFAGWRTRWRFDRNDHSRRMESNYIWNKIDYLAALAQKELITDMSCDLQAGFDSLADAIREASPNQGLIALASAIRQSGNSSCCDDIVINQNGGIQGTVTAPGSGRTIPVYGSVPPISLPPGEFPPEFESEAAYMADKCQQANLIVSGVIGTLNGLALLDGVNIIGVGALIAAAAFGVITLGPAAIAVIAAIIPIAIGIGVYLAALADYISDHREEMVCIMYQSDSTEEAISVLADFIDTALDAIGVAGALTGYVGTIVLVLLNSDTLNALFQYTAHALYPDADCSGCLTGWRVYNSEETYSSGDDWQYLFGVEVSSYEDGVWPLTGENQPVHIVKIGFAGLVTVNIATSGHTSHLYLTEYYLYSDVDFSFTNVSYASDTFYGLPVTAGAIYIVSSSAFTVTLSEPE